MLCGRNRARTCDLICVRAVNGLSIISIQYMWSYLHHVVVGMGGKVFHYVHYFHVVFSWLHTVAHDMLRERQIKALFIFGKVRVSCICFQYSQVERGNHGWPRSKLL